MAEEPLDQGQVAQQMWAGVVERTRRRAGLDKEQVMTLDEKQRSQAGA